MDAQARLIVTNGPNLGQIYLLVDDSQTIGRSTSNSIVLPSPEISRKHARVWCEGESTYLEDLGSTNGTFVNDTRLEDPVALYDGDEIQIGDTFRLLYASPEGVTRPFSLVQPEDLQTPQSAAAAYDQPGALEISPASEIPTPRPPLYPGLGESNESLEQAALNRQRRLLKWFGFASLLVIAACMMMLLFLDSYKGGQLLYCGSLNSFFQVVLGPFGFNPLCP